MEGEEVSKDKIKINKDTNSTQTVNKKENE